jgi:hypothetical protein
MKKMLTLFSLVLFFSFFAAQGTYAFDAAAGYVDSIAVIDRVSTKVYSTLNGAKITLYLRPEVVGYSQADRMFAQLLTALIKNKLVGIGTASSTATDITYVTIVR